MTRFDEEHRMMATDAWGFVFPAVAKTHREEDCTAPCAIHAPSDHPLNEAPMVMRSDKGMLIERTCEHGVGHPDPDSLWFIVGVSGDPDMSALGVHGCDGCCRVDKPE